MASSNNIIILNGILKDFKSTNELSIPDSDILELFVANQITKKYELSFEEISESIVDGGLDGGIDSLFVLVDEKLILENESADEITMNANTSLELNIIQTKSDNNFKETALDKLIASIPILMDLDISEEGLLTRFNPSITEKIQIFRKLWLQAVRKHSEIIINYYYTCKANQIEYNSAFNSKVNQLKHITSDKVSGAKVEFIPISSKELIDLHSKSIISSLEIKFKESPISVIYKTGQIGYIGVANLNDFFRFITDSGGNIKENIFESNIRHYQGDVDVNNSIKETLEKDYERDFWWLNNGITMIASQVGQVGKVLTLENVQIVNGLQTSFTIGKYFEEKQEEERAILVKIIISQDKESIDKIIAATNRQNPVSPALLRATDNTQRMIELFFNNEGYYYDRRKNYYKNQGKAASKIFSIQYTAQSIEAILNYNPSSARSKPTSLIKSEKSYLNIFDSRANFKAYLISCLIVQKVSNFIRLEVDQETKNITRNFTYHISRTLAAFWLEKSSYTRDEISEINLNNIGEEGLDKMIDKSAEFIFSSVSEYLGSNPNENIINVSKSQKFTDQLNNNLLNTFHK